MQSKLIDTLISSSFFSGPPSVLQQGPVTALVGHNITLHCDVEGDPKPTTSWIAPVSRFYCNVYCPLTYLTYMNNSYHDFQKDIWIHICTVVSISIFFEHQFSWGSLLSIHKTQFEILYLVIWCIHWIHLILHFLTTWRVFELKTRNRR